MSGCLTPTPECVASRFAGSVIGGTLETLANGVLEAVGRAAASLGTLWVRLGTPDLVGGEGVPTRVGAVAPGSEGIETVLSWVMWVALAVCVIALFAAAASVIRAPRDGGYAPFAERVSLPLVAAVLISAAVALVSAILPSGSAGGSPTVAYIANSTWWYTVAFAAVGVIVGAARMAWEQRADPGKDLVRSMLTLAVVAGAGVTVVQLLTAAADEFAVWIIDGSLDCSVIDDACFGRSVTQLLRLSTADPAVMGMGAVLVILLGVTALLASLLQVVLMVVRSGMLVLLCGVLPVSAAATNTGVGRAMFAKASGWTLAFILYKPAAALVYATAFRLTGTNPAAADDGGLMAVVSGISLMLLALIALPALMGLIVPAVGAVASGGGGGAMAGAALAAVPTGAVALSGRGGVGAGSGRGPSGAAVTPAQSPPTLAGPSGAGPAMSAMGKDMATPAAAAAGPAGATLGVALQQAAQMVRAARAAATDTAQGGTHDHQ